MIENDDDDIKPIDFGEPQFPDDEMAGNAEPEIDYDQIAYGAKMRRIKKGEELDIVDLDPTLVTTRIGFGWDLKNFEQRPLDLDGSLFFLDKDDMTRENEDFIFYNNLADSNKAVLHEGDSRTGAGDGDDETIKINLPKLSYEILKIVVVISIYDEEMVGYSFDDVTNLFVRVTNPDSDHELFRFELQEDDLGIEGASAMIVGVFERIGPKWVFRAIGEPVQGGLAEIATQYGIIVNEMMGQD